MESLPLSSCGPSAPQRPRPLDVSGGSVPAARKGPGGRSRAGTQMRFSLIKYLHGKFFLRRTCSISCGSSLSTVGVLHPASVLMLREKVLMLQLILGLTKVHLHLREQKVSPTDSSEGFIPFPINWQPPASTHPAPRRGLW